MLDAGKHVINSRKTLLFQAGCVTSGECSVIGYKDTYTATASVAQL